MCLSEPLNRRQLLLFGDAPKARRNGRHIVGKEHVTQLLPESRVGPNLLYQRAHVLSGECHVSQSTRVAAIPGCRRDTTRAAIA